VIAVSAFGDTLCEALKQSYSQVAELDFKDKNYRRDIGQDLL
jgi:phosphoribosylamine--glycine ligase